MEFEIKNRFTGKLQFTAKIEADENTSRSIKIGLAVKWGIENNAGLTYADLRYANLTSANLTYANLTSADLTSANLTYANLTSANLRYANLTSADLRYANLTSADLTSANLTYANLTSANLTSANLTSAIGEFKHLKTTQIEDYPISYTSEILQIGCEKHSIDEWRDFDDYRIIQMDGQNALKFWRKWKGWIFQTIEMSPAKPTGFVKKSEDV